MFFFNIYIYIHIIYIYICYTIYVFFLNMYIYICLKMGFNQQILRKPLEKWYVSPLGDGKIDESDENTLAIGWFRDIMRTLWYAKVIDFRSRIWVYAPWLSIYRSIVQFYLSIYLSIYRAILSISWSINPIYPIHPIYLYHSISRIWIILDGCFTMFIGEWFLFLVSIC